MAGSQTSQAEQEHQIITSTSMESHGLQPKAIDSHWLFKYQGKDWPVVLCGDALAPKKFIALRQRPTEIPAILLGKRIYIWVTKSKLREYNPNADYLADHSNFEREDVTCHDDEGTKVEKQRRLAFRQDAPSFGGASFWKNYIERQLEARRIERQRNASSLPLRHKKRPREASQDSSERNVRRRRHDSVLDSTTSAEQQAESTPGTSLPSIQQGSPQAARTEGGGSDGGSDGSESDDETLSDVHPQAEDEACTTTVRQERQRNIQAVLDNPPAHGMCNILVGPEKQAFLLKIDAASKSGILAERVRYSKSMGSYIDISGMSEVLADKFAPVHEYLVRGEFEPNIVKGSDGFEKLASVILGEEQDEAAEKCAWTFSAAGHLQLDGLQSLCVKKLKAKKEISPFKMLLAGKLGLGTKRWGSSVEVEFLEWLEGRMAKLVVSELTDGQVELARNLRSTILTWKMRK